MYHLNEMIDIKEQMLKFRQWLNLTSL